MKKELDQDNTEPDGRALVVTGSSAGGIEVLSTIFSSLSAKFPAPIVVAQHLDPNFQSRLGEILGKRSRLTVKLVESEEALQPGTIYVVPSGCDVEIEDRHVAVKHATSKNRIKPSVDRLFQSAAKAYGEHLIAVVLTGMGNDGVAGAREVKERGGTVIVQEPASAEYPSMPLALPPTLVDFTRKADAIGSLIEELITRTSSGTEDHEQGLRTLLKHVRDRSGIDFLQYKTPTIRRRLTRLMAAAGCATFDEYKRHLERNPEAYQRLISSFLIKVTSFFRDAALYKALSENILPRLIKAAREGDKELRLWSAGCATGEEAYSLAILVAELLRDEEACSVRIFATDLDEEAVAFARRGVYSADAFEDVPEQLLARYFGRLGDAYEVGKLIRNMTVFGQHDLGQRAPFPRIDLVLCRNVLIYFTKELQQHALQLFAFSLRDRGFLVLGKAETANPAPEFFKPAESTLKIFERQGARVLIPPSRLRDTYQPITATRRASSRVLMSMPPRVSERPATADFIGSSTFNSPAGIVVVDRRYDIVSINRAARVLFNVRGIGVGEDLLHTATSIDTGALRSLIDAALRNDADQPSAIIEVRLPGEGDRYLQVLAYGERSLDNVAQADSVVLIVIDVTEMAREKHELERRAKEQATEMATLRDRGEELGQRQRLLLESNDELTTANLELRSVNEQLLIGLEEAASSAEEIETLNEEMQATNEELETLNEELQATVEELNTTNDELEARSRKLEEDTKKHEGALRESNQANAGLKVALEELEQPIALVSGDGSLLFKNAAFGKLLPNLTFGLDGGTVSLNDLPKADIESEELILATSNGATKNQYRARIRRLNGRGMTLFVILLQPTAAQ